TPLLSQTVRLWGWGLIVRPAPVTTYPLTLPDPVELALTARPGTDRAATLGQLVTLIHAPAAAPVALPEEEAAVEIEPPAQDPAGVDVLALLLAAWCVTAGALALRLLVALVCCWRVLARAYPVEEPRLRRAAAQAVARLGLRLAPVLYTADRARSPM